MSDAAIADIGEDYKFGFSMPERSVLKAQKGLSPEVVTQISRAKGEPEWMLRFRLRALETFRKLPMPHWGADLSNIDFDDIYYYIKPTENSERTWDDVPDDIVHPVGAEGLAHALELGQQRAENRTLARVARHEVVDHNLFLLAVTVDSTHPLLKPDRRPRHVVIHHQ